tara:strand:+ start:3716 stop:4180 length:465 start_codon:yes stop_codon:yes gene_type:complete
MQSKTHNMKHLYKVIQFGIEQYNICEDKKEKAGIKYGTKMLIRQIITKKLWSENALKVAQENNIPLDLDWYKQSRYDPGRKMLLMEHKNPLEEMWQKLIAEPDKTTSILDSENIIVWVTREEDNKLTELGYRSKRPDSDKAYQEAGIEIASVAQ